MHYRDLFFCFIFSLSLTNVWPQQRNYKTFTEDDGLPSSTIYSIFQDSKGYLWFATDKGVSRYDGYQFNNYNVNDGLSDNEVLNFFEDSNDRLWFYTLNGKVSYYLNNRFHNSSNDSSLIALDSKSMITSIFEDANNNIWMTVYNYGLIKYSKDGRVQRYFEDGSLDFINGSLLISQNTLELIARYNLVQVSLEKEINVLGNEKIPIFKYGVYNSKNIKISDNKFWFSHEGKILEKDITKGSIRLVYDKGSFHLNINNLCRFEDEIWLCTTSGAVRYSIENQLFEPPILNSYSIGSVFKDLAGNYWVGTLNNGVIFYSANQIFHFDTNNGLKQDQIVRLKKDEKSNIWFTYSIDGVGILNNRRNIDNLKFNSNLKNGSRRGVNNIFFQGDKQWIATNYGLVLYNGGVFQKKIGLTSKDIIIDKYDKIWLATSSGLYNFNQEVFDWYSKNLLTDFDDFKIINKRFSHLFLGIDDYIWLIGQNEVFKIDPDSIQNITSVLKGYRINDFLEYNRDVALFATNGSGLEIIKNSTAQNISKKNGLSSNICTSIAIDKDSIIWVGTNKGLNKIKGYPNSIEIEHYGILDGLRSEVINDILIINDTLWLATNKGLNFFDKRNFVLNKGIPTMQIESVSINDNHLNFRNKPIELPFNQNDIIINYVGISLNGGGDVIYKYKLNEEASWKYTRNRTINFSSLSPGDYVFSIAARGKTGVWSDEKRLKIIVSKPLWQSYWFIVLSSFLMLILTGLIVRQILRNQRLRIEQEQRVITSELKSLKAQINPHFVFNALNSIQGELLKKEPEVALNYLGKLGRLMRKVLDHSEQLYVCVADEISILTDYLDTEKFKTGHKFDYSIEVSKQLDTEKIQIPSMIIQPFAENSIWHGFTEPNHEYFLTIRFDFEDGIDLVVKIIDNGIGRSRASQTTKKSYHSKGLNMVSERFEALNFGKGRKMSFEIDDIMNENNRSKGTVVTLRIPQT